MATVMDNIFSEEDRQLCYTHQLGTPYSIYRLKPSTYRSSYIMCGIVFIIGIFDLIVTLFTHHITDTSISIVAQINNVLGYVIILLTGLKIILAVQQEKSTHILVCEYGLLATHKRAWHRHVEAIRWQDITYADIGATPYSIHYYDDEKKVPHTLSISSLYQNHEELAALILEHSAEFRPEEPLLSRFVIAAPHEGVKYRCPCCGFKTLNARGGNETCPVCDWIDIGQDNADADRNYISGPNHISLTLARENYQRYGAVNRQALAYVRHPSLEER